MKNLSLISSLLFVVFLFSACKKNQDVPPIPEPKIDLAAEVVGTFAGTIVEDGFIYLDTYRMTISKINETRIRCKGEDERIPAFESDLAEAPEISGVDWITQPNTYQLDSVFTYVREEAAITVIRTELNIEFYGEKE